MAKSKNVRKQPEITPWKRWKLWLSRNEKVLWVVLLVLVAPLFAFTAPVDTFFRPNAANTVRRVYYGEKVTLADLQKAVRSAQAARQIAPSALAAASDLVLGGSERGLDPYNFYLFKKKAERLGIRVSGTELGERIQELWRENEALRLAWEEVSASPDSANQQQQMFRLYQLRMEKQKELSERGVYDLEGWKTMVKNVRQPLRVFEEFLGDLYSIAKLQEYVASSVKVSPQEVYEEFRKERQKRLLSWATWKPSAELLEKLSAGATDDELKAYHTENKADFARPLAVRASYVVVPEEQFKAESEKNLTDEDLEEYYSSHVNDYRTGAILAEEATFALRTKEEQEEFEKALFKPLDEVKEDVREKVLETKTKSALTAFTNNTLRQKLFPGADDDAQVPSLEALKSEYPYLTTGTTEYATRDDAEEVFGDVYTTEVNRWFRELDPPPGSQTPAKTEVTPPRWPQTVESGRIFYTQVEVRPAYDPDFTEVAEEVREAYTKTKAIEAVAGALEKAISTDGEGSATEGEGDSSGEKPSLQERVETLLAEGVEVQVGEETLSVHPEAEGLVTATEYVRRYGNLRYVPSPTEDTEEPDEEDASKDDPEGDASEEEDEGPEEEVLASSRVVCDVAFDIEAKGQLAVARDAAEDSCYLVRFDDVIYPDSSEFDTHKGYLENRLLRERRGIYLAEWHRDVLREAEPNVDLAPAEPASEG